MKLKNSSIALLICGVLITLSGCSNNKAIIAEQNALLEEQEALIVEKNTIIVEKNTIIDELNNSITGCENELVKMRAQCNEQLTLQETKDQQLLLRERELREHLAEDIEAKNIEIEKLRGYLTVKVMDKVLFRSGSIDILPEGETILTRIAASLVDTREGIQVEGHTDDVPIGALLISRIPTNWELSVLRAASVVRFLEKNNIYSGRMAAVGHSKFKPVAENTDDENRQLNRRVEIVLVPNDDFVDPRISAE